MPRRSSLNGPSVLPLEGPAPCDLCHLAARCASERTACQAFVTYMRGRSDWRRRPMIPSPELGHLVFTTREGRHPKQLELPGR